MKTMYKWCIFWNLQLAGAFEKNGTPYKSENIRSLKCEDVEKIQGMGESDFRMVNEHTKKNRDNRKMNEVGMHSHAKETELKYFFGVAEADKLVPRFPIIVGQGHGSSRFLFFWCVCIKFFALKF